MNKYNNTTESWKAGALCQTLPLSFALFVELIFGRQTLGSRGSYLLA